MNNNNITTNKKQPSKELVNLVIELKATIAKLKDLYKRIDKKALEEGFSDGEIYEDIDDIIITKTKSLSSPPTATKNNDTTTTTMN